MSGYVTIRAAAALDVGALDTCQAAAESIFALDLSPGSPCIAPACGLIARVALHRGNVSQARAAVDTGLAAADGFAIGNDLLLWSLALIEEAEGHPDAALQTLQRMWEAFPAFRHGWTIGIRSVDLARIALKQDQRQPAEEIAEVLAVAAKHSDAPTASGAADLIHALLIGDVDLARRAVDGFAAGPRILATAQAQEMAAEMLPDKEAVALLRSASAAYDSAGAAHDVARVRAAMRSRGVSPGARGARRRPLTGWDSLTPSERHVVALAAEGLTTRRIGERLYLSVNTIETHLRNVYRKLGIASRAELATQAARAVEQWG
jgi:DNA-binding CsgD family transcriptional regulator